MTTLQLTILCGIALCAFSCSEPGREQVTEGPYSDTADFHESRRAAMRPDSAALEAADDARRERDQAVVELRRKVDRNRLDIEELKGKTRKMKAEAKAEYEASLRELEEKNEDLKQRLSKAEGMIESDWQAFRAGLNQELDNIGKNVEELFNRNKKDKK